MTEAQNDITTAPTPHPWWKRPVTLIITGVIVLALLIAGGVALLSPPSANVTACKLYEDGFNQVADAVHMKAQGMVDADHVQSQFARLPARIKDAQQSAFGDVAVEMRSSQELSQQYLNNSDSEDLGIAFFLSTVSVEDACAADGAGIKLHEMK